MDELRSFGAELKRLGGSAGGDEGGHDLVREAMTVGIDLRNTEVNDAKLAGIASMPAFRFVGQLNLAGTPITDEGVKLLQGHPSLVGLDLSRTAVTERSFEFLAAVPVLNSLSLSGPWVSDAGLETLAARRRPTPAVLPELPDTAVTEEGVGKLSAAFTQWIIIYGPSSNPKCVR
jgi:hypothetical protein